MGFLKKLGLKKKKASKTEPLTEDTKVEEHSKKVPTQPPSQAIPPHVRPPGPIELLAAAGFDTTDLERLSSDSCPFIWACDHGHNEVLKLLLSHAPDPAIVNRVRLERIPGEYWQRSAADVATKKAEFSCIATMHRMSADISSDNRKSMFEAILRKDTVVDLDDLCDVVLGNWFPPTPENEALGPAASERADTIFMSSIRNQRSELTEWLWENGLEKYKRKQTPWMAWDSLEEKIAIEEADASSDTRNPSIEYLRRVGVIETMIEAQFYSPIHRLIRGCHYRREIAMKRVASLLAKGWDVNARNRNGSTPLHIAVAGSELSVMEFLIKNGADINAREISTKARTPILIAMEHGDPVFLNILLKNGAQFQPTAQDDLGGVLFIAAAAGNTVAVSMLLQKGADPRQKNSFGETPYKVAMLRNNLGAAAVLKSAVSAMSTTYNGEPQSSPRGGAKNINVSVSNVIPTTMTDNLKPLDNAILRWD